MAKRNEDLFHRLRRAGIRKPVANTLSELTEDAGKKAAGARHRAVAELRALADEIERRLPTAKLAETPAPPTAPTPSRPRPVRKLAAKVPVTQPRTTATTKPATARRATPKPAAPKRAAAKPAAPKAAASKSGTPAARASRGENKSKILTALKTGPQTASEISQTTGIATATVSTALTRLSKAGEVSKADRGYALPT